MFIVNNVFCYAMKQELLISAFPTLYAAKVVIFSMSTYKW